MAFLDFSFKVHRLLAKDFDQLPVDLMVGFRLLLPVCGFFLFLVFQSVPQSASGGCCLFLMFPEP